MYVYYTDGSASAVGMGSSNLKTRNDLVTVKGKSVSKIVCYISSYNNVLVYNIGLIEGNKIPTEIPTAQEDVTGQSNVNLLDNSNFKFGLEGYFPNQAVTLDIVNGVLQVRTSQTSSTPGMYSKIHLKSGIYTFKIRAKAVHIAMVYFYLYDAKDLSKPFYQKGWDATTTRDQSVQLAIPSEGDYRYYILISAHDATTYPAGFDIEYFMLTAGSIAPQDWNPSAGDVAKDIKQVSNAVTNLNTTINGAFKDGIIDKAETDLIKSNINTLNAEKKGIDAGYATLYNNVYLLSGSTAAINLTAAKTAYNTAHANLISSINTAIADGKATVAEKADVDAKFTAYGVALANYEDKVEAANKAIQDTVRNNSVAGVTKGSKYYVGQMSAGVIHGVCLFQTTMLEKTNVMARVDFEGYMYGIHAPFGVSIVFYAFTSGLTNYGYTVTGTDTISGIRLGIKGGKIAIEIKLKADVYYLCFNISIESTNMALPVAYSQGWTFASQTLASGNLIDSTYSNIVVVPERDNLAGSLAKAAQNAADTAIANANTANDKLTTWASDRYISPQEKTGLRQQLSDMQAEQYEIVANANRYVISFASYMEAYNSAIAALNKYTAASPENIEIIQSEYAEISAYYTARQTILNSIAAAAKAQADKSTGAIGIGEGKMLYKDPEFKVGTNGVTRYAPQNGGGTSTLTRILKSSNAKASGSPYTGSNYCLYMTTHGGTSTDHLGGFYFGNSSRANAVFIVKVSAKIPVGYTLDNVHNSLGVGSKLELLTPIAGTGKYEMYIFKVTCGNSGVFNTANHLRLSGPIATSAVPCEWFVDYATVFDLTADGYSDIELVTKDSLAAQLGFANFEALKANAFKKGFVKAGLIEADVIDVNTLAANDAFIDKLRTNILTANTIKSNMIDSSSIFSMKMNVNNKFIVDENGVMSCFDAKLSGNLYLTPFHITNDNFFDVTTIITGGQIPLYKILFNKTGLNIQVDYNEELISLELPRELKYEGAEVNISYGATSDPRYTTLSVKYMSVNRNATPGLYQRVSVSVLPLECYKFKCIVSDAPSNYPYDLIDGKVVEWILIK